MKEMSLSQRYAVIALDGLESLHPSMAKSAVLRAIAAARALEEVILDNEEDEEKFAAALNVAVDRARRIKKKEEEELEAEVAALLEVDGVMEQVPDILGCDMDYYTAGVTLKAYRSSADVYIRIKEEVRAEILEDGAVSFECVCLLFLFRESGCIHDLFSIEEQNRLQSRMLSLTAENPAYRLLWQAEFHSAVESFVGKFLRAKRNFFKNPYMEGVNLIFPYLERRRSIFIDFVIFGTSVQDRRLAVAEFLTEKGHYVEMVTVGSETLLKVDNSYYRVFPMVKRSYKVPIQGANIVPVFW